jgi:hypothetical protein
MAFVLKLNKDVIEQGATFYREVVPYTDSAKTELLSLEAKTPRATLIDSDEVVIAQFACAVLAATTLLPARIAVVMSRGDTALLTPGGTYYTDVDLDHSDGITTTRATRFQFKVNLGQVKAI